MTGQGEEMHQGWNQGTDYLLFMGLFLPKLYLGEGKCPVEQTFHLSGNHHYTCEQQNIDNYLYGLKGTKADHIDF